MSSLHQLGPSLERTGMEALRNIWQEGPSIRFDCCLFWFLEGKTGN